jgi:hypothetical protein
MPTPAWSSSGSATKRPDDKLGISRLVMRISRNAPSSSTAITELSWHPLTTTRVRNPETTRGMSWPLRSPRVFPVEWVHVGRRGPFYVAEGLSRSRTRFPVSLNEITFSGASFLAGLLQGHELAARPVTLGPGRRAAHPGLGLRPLLHRAFARCRRPVCRQPRSHPPMLVW